MKNVLYLSLLSVLFLFGCSSEELQTTDSPNADLNQVFAKGIGNAPEQSGPHLFRYEDSYWIYVEDMERGISAAFGVDFEALCGGEDWWGVANNQVIVVPSDELRIVLLNQGEVITNVFDGFFNIDVDDPCVFFDTTTNLGHGLVKFVATDNDFDISGNNNTNTFGFRGHGRLENEAGDSKNFTTIQHFSINKKKEQFTAKVSLRLQN